MNEKIKTVVLLIIILFSTGILILVMGWTGYIPFFKNSIDNIQTKITQNDQETLLMQKRELELISQVENEKMLEAIREENRVLEEKRVKLEEQEKKLQALATALEEEKNNFLKAQELAKQTEKEKTDYQQKVDELAATFVSMPPPRAVERIVALQDDMLIIDVMKTIDRKAAEDGTISITPLYFSLMDEKDASRILKKSTITF